MPRRRLPVRPDRASLLADAEALHREARAGQSAALGEVAEACTGAFDAASVTLAQAQHALAQSYTAPDWQRLMHAVELVDAIWRDELETVRNGMR